MKNQKQGKPKSQKQKSKPAELTEEALKKLLQDAGFVFVNKKERTFGKPDGALHQGETMIFPEGSTRGFKVK